MPFIEEEELSLLKKEVSNLTTEKEALETQLKELEELHDSELNKANKNNVFFGILAAIAIAFAAFLYFNGNTTASDGDDQETIETISEDDNQNQESYSDDDLATDDDQITELSSEENIKDFTKKTSNKKIYSVQVGIFYKKRLPSISETIAGITTNGELFKYSIGIFDNLKEAQKFRKELVRIGFKDAFICSYINGKRQKIEEPFLN